MKFSSSLILSFVLACVSTLAAEKTPHYFGARPGALAEVKERLSKQDPELKPALKALLKDADEALRVQPPSVTEKPRPAPSGSKHDYMTAAPYFWPDPSKPDGLPYLRKDGKVNPEVRTDAYDHQRLGMMTKTVETLAMAYHFTGNEDYAAHAAKCLRVWFLDPATRMNPHLNFAQAEPGKNAGRAAGVIEGRNLVNAGDAAGLMLGSKSWPAEDHQALLKWMSDYLDWLMTSEIGRDEGDAKNNHGTFYDIQIIGLALMLDRKDLAKEIAETAKRKRIAAQIEPDGRQPHELARTNSFDYSRFNLSAFFALATLAEHAGVDLWNHRTEDGRSMQNALDFLLPFISEPKKKWTYPQIIAIDPDKMVPLLVEAVSVYQDLKYAEALAALDPDPADRMLLLVPRPFTPVDVPSLDRPRILKAAASALVLEPFTITRFPAKLSEGGPNDFYSNGDYWWPDPSKPDGLPFIRRDGLSNPGNFSHHRMAVRQLNESLAALAAAYQISREERYVNKAAELLRVFFIDPKTRMNPHLNYAQAIPGVSPGRGIGIIDTLHLIEIPVAIAALEESKAFPQEISSGMRKWFTDYLDWMITSENGKEEAVAGNNHAVAYWLQAAVFARFTGDEKRLAESRRHFKEVFVGRQMAVDGSFPAELSRTKPYAYSIFQLDNMASLCQVLSTVEDDLWSYELPDGRGIRKAMDYLYPYLADKSKWPLPPDVQSWEEWPSRQPSLLFAGMALKENRYLELWRGLPADPTDLEVRRNIAITQPLLWILPSRVGK
jgi:hypothetical protein